MELTLVNLLLAIITIFISRFVYSFVKYRYLSSKITNIPSVKNKFPILRLLSGKKDAYDIFHKELFDENGAPNRVIRGGPGFEGEPRIWFSEPDTIKEVLTNTDKFSKYKPIYGVMGAYLGDGLVCTYNREIHKKNRKLITPLFHYGALKGMITTINNLLKTEISDLRALNGQPIESRQIEHWTMRVIIAVAFGDAFPVKWMASTYQSYTGTMNLLFVWDFLIGNISHYMPAPFNLKRWNLRKQIEAKIIEAVQSRKTQLADETIDTNDIKDLLTLLLKSGDENLEKTIIDEGLTFLFAGYDTTSKLLQWSFYFLCKFPEMQNKARNEINSVLQDSQDIEDSHLQKLTYCKNVLNESLRLRPPVTNLSRTVVEDCVLSGTFIPKGTTVNMYLHGAHMDPKHWENPGEFRPERWDEKHERHAFSFVPFSAGERNCIGQKLANQEALMIMAMIIKNFTIESPNLDEVKMGLDALLTPINLKLSFKPIVN